MSAQPIHPDVDYALAPYLAQRTLRQVETLFLDGEISLDLLTAYLYVWAHSPGLSCPEHGAAWRTPPETDRVRRLVDLIQSAIPRR